MTVTLSASEKILVLLSVVLDMKLKWTGHIVGWMMKKQWEYAVWMDATHLHQTCTWKAAARKKKVGGIPRDRTQ
jgi:hypothetical protein